MLNQFRGLVALGALGLLSNAAAAGILGTTGSFFNSSFCRAYGCGEPYRSGQNWMYRLNTGDLAFIRRENNDAQGRIEMMALFINEDSFHADVDRETFAALQKTAIGYTAFTGRIEPCYGATGVRELTSYPAPNAQSIVCLRDSNRTAIALLADLSYSNTAPAPAYSGSGGPPKLMDWLFTTCRSNRGVTATLPLGEGAVCTLRVNATLNGHRLISATFDYELEYPAGRELVKMRLPGRDTYVASGGGNVKFAQQGNSLNFSLPLNVRARADRRYVRLGVIGTLVFDDGTTKRVYEALNIQ